jgi:hypothetical protein
LFSIGDCLTNTEVDEVVGGGNGLGLTGSGGFLASESEALGNDAGVEGCRGLGISTGVASVVGTIVTAVVLALTIVTSIVLTLTLALAIVLTLTLTVVLALTLALTTTLATIPLTSDYTRHILGASGGGHGEERSDERNQRQRLRELHV